MNIDIITVPIGFLGMHGYALGIVNYSLISNGFEVSRALQLFGLVDLHTSANPKRSSALSIV